jgi:hypothetical protein
VGRYNLTIFSILLVLVVTACSFIQPGYATSSYLIGVQNSQACITMLIHHIPNHCIPYNKQLQFDTTNKLISGMWINDTYYHRLPPKIIDHYRFTPNPWVVMVDPNNDFTTRAKMITVQADNFTYINPDEVVNGHTRHEYDNRFVYTNCQSAIVAPNLFIIEDTINYLESGCTVTHYNETRTILLHDTPTDITKTQAWKNQQWYSQAKQVTKDCIRHKCDNLTDPNKKAKWGS